ncbi:PhoPQ-activated pathogenicity-related family protein [Paludisphaera soli]|uniref:PhoPQ-activated pathogenicity-related family protein n=1 Tax=Paludisphaera soli TaxID=2712865 RepID=UPI001F117258|nr:PhoPQ-activated protein PqaA family protein [Paludisphaera soli]
MRFISHRGSPVASLLAIAAGLAFASAPPTVRADLDEYVKKADPAFAWKQVETQDLEGGKVSVLELTSQVWQGITWTHSLRIYEGPKTTYDDSVLLFITGGSTGNKPGPDMEKLALTLANLSGGRVALLSQVPNQPLLDGKKEDELIAETFIRYLETKDESWPLLFPMAKSAVRAMDAVQAWAKQERQLDVKKFVVTGASKRGWTTWLSGAVDDRVIAIAPMVIVMLNIGEQGPNQLDVWGFYSEQIDDYVKRGLMEKVKTGPGTQLWQMVDPYTYRDRLVDKPKFLLNGANDRYWTLNAIDLYWDGLSGPKYLMALPNAGHGLDGDRSWVFNGLAAFFRSSVTGRTMPKVDWNFEDGGKGQFSLKVNSDPPPKSARIWSADSQTRDFREAKWAPKPLEPGALVSAIVTAPEDGHRAVYADLEYELDGLSYHLTTTFFEPGLDAKAKKDAKPAAVPVGAGADR